MQAQKEFTDAEPAYEAEGTVVFTTKNKPYKLLIAVLTVIYKPLFIVSTVLELLLLVLGVFAHATELLPVFAATALLLLLSSFILHWCVRRLNGPVGNPVLLLSPDGLTLKTEPFLETIPWDEIASVEAGNLMGVPAVIVKPKDHAALKARLGDRGRYRWMYEMAGGSLVFSCVPFGLSPADLVARINRYRERGL